jgi:hypothetical protein
VKSSLENRAALRKKNLHNLWHPSANLQGHRRPQFHRQSLA